MGGESLLRKHLPIVKFVFKNFAFLKKKNISANKFFYKRKKLLAHK